MSFADPSISARAREAYDAGERGLAEAICRLQLHSGVGGEAERRAWQLLARIAHDVGRGDVEAEYVARKDGEEKILSPAPSWKEGESEDGHSPAATREPTPQPPPPGRGSAERLLLIRAWGQGFFADVDHVLGQLLLAEITGRTPLVWWGAESRFGDGGVSNAWERYFEPVSSVTIEDIIARAGDRSLAFFPSRWNFANLRDVHLPLLDPPASRPAPVDVLDRSEDVVVSTMHGSMAMILPWTRPGHWPHGASVPEAFAGLARRHLKPSARIIRLVDAAHESLFAPHQGTGGKVIAVHLRGCDKVGEDPAIGRSREEALSRVDARIRQDSRWRVLVLTDFEPMVARCRERFGERAMFTRVRRSAGKVGLHFDPARDGPALGDEVLVDVLLATRCDAFVGVGSSNVSTAASYLKEWQGACELIGERYFERVNPMAYL